MNLVELHSNAADGANDHIADALIRAGRGDPVALRYLYDHSRAKLFSICLRICGDISAAEDVLHDVYLIVWQRPGAWEPGRGNPMAWLAAIARNRAIDWQRTKGRQPIPVGDALPETADPEPSAEMRLITAGEERRLSDHFARLNPRFQDAIRSAFFDGYTYADIAADQSVPIGTIKSRIHNGLAKLKQDLNHDDAASLALLRAI